MLYRFLALPLSYVYAGLLASRERGKIRLEERFGDWGMLPTEVIWFHGASVGEVQGLAPVITAVRQRTDVPILLTVTSATALNVAEELTPYVRMLPFDAPQWIHRAFDGINVRAAVFCETEIWPNIYEWLSERRVPLCLINARVSEKSLRWYKRLVGESTFAGVATCLCADQMMADRFRDLGVSAEKLKIAGNTKYARRPLAIEKGTTIGSRFAFAGPSIVIGNIRPGEEELIFPAVKRVVQQNPSCRFVIVPRHREKYGYFQQRLNQFEIHFVRWSDEKPVEPGQVLFVDTFGVLERLYADADGALVCGSVVDYGGHNPLEPAPYGVPVAIGPFTSATGSLVPDLINVDAITQVRSTDEIADFFINACARSEVLIARAERLSRFWKEQQVALDTVLDELGRYVELRAA